MPHPTSLLPLSPDHFPRPVQPLPCNLQPHRRVQRPAGRCSSLQSLGRPHLHSGGVSKPALCSGNDDAIQQDRPFCPLSVRRAGGSKSQLELVTLLHFQLFASPTSSFQMPAAIVSSKGGGRVTRAAAPAATTASFSGGGELCAKGGFSFGSGGGGGAGSSDISRYRLHVEPASAAAAASVVASKAAGLQIYSSSSSKAADVSVTSTSAASGLGTNRLKPAVPHAWMDSCDVTGVLGHDCQITCDCNFYFQTPLLLREMLRLPGRTMWRS
jgi:hypothetical protein